MILIRSIDVDSGMIGYELFSLVDERTRYAIELPKFYRCSLQRSGPAMIPSRQNSDVSATAIDPRPVRLSQSSHQQSYTRRRLHQRTAAASPIRSPYINAQPYTAPQQCKPNNPIACHPSSPLSPSKYSCPSLSFFRPAPNARISHIRQSRESRHGGPLGGATPRPRQ